MITKRRLGNVIYASRWLLYPINVALIAALLLYVGVFLINDYHFIIRDFKWEMEPLMVMMLGFVDAAMVANLMIVIVQGGHQIFVQKFEFKDKHDRAQYLDHIDSGLLKVKVAQSIAGITLVQILKDFVALETVGWTLVLHRIEIHGVALASAFMMAMIWRVTHPAWQHGDSNGHK